MERFGVLSDLLDKVVRNTLVLLVVGGATLGFFKGLVSPENYMGLVTTIIGLVLGAKAVQQGYQEGVKATTTTPPRVP